MTHRFDLVLEDEIEHCNPIYRNVGCRDGEERCTGGVRIPPDILDKIDADFPESYLPTDTPAVQGLSPFSMVEENQFAVFESADFTDGHSLHAKLWTSIQVHNLDLLSEGTDKGDDEPAGVFVGSSPERYDVDKMALYCPRLDIAAFERINLGGEPDYIIYDFSADEFTRSIRSSGLDFYDVPDEVLMKILPEEYNPDVVANSL